MKHISSFDIFDTCLIRRCSTPENFFDVLSIRVFNGEVEEWVRQEFVAARRLTEQQLCQENPYYTLQDIWQAFTWTHQLLKTKEKLCQLEQDMEKEMLVPVLKMREKVNECRKHGETIIFISDMYLATSFLMEVMREHGFYQDGDSLYVSCECKATKYNGSLFQYVKEKEQLRSFRHWHHYGDNKISDYQIPRKLGIRATLIDHKYTPYQQQWLDNDYSLGFHTPSVMAGLGHAIRYSSAWTTHTDFVLDIVAPFYCSLVYRIMHDAEKSGIKRLYFCARDAVIMYKIALLYAHIFPKIECNFLYISRKALYDGDEHAKLLYYQQIGLATKNDSVGIVDIRSTGKTLCYLNELLTSEGYNTVKGYYYELFCYSDTPYYPSSFYTELNSRYNMNGCKMIVGVWQLFENFFTLNEIPKTVDYTIKNGIAEPVYGTDEADGTLKNQQFRVEKHSYWCKIHTDLIISYATEYIQSGLYVFSNEVFLLSNNTLFQFIDSPNRHYLEALTCLYGIKGDKGQWLPYIKKASWLHLVRTHAKDTFWREATYIYNNFDWFVKLYRNFINPM